MCEKDIICQSNVLYDEFNDNKKDFKYTDIVNICDKSTNVNEILKSQLLDEPNTHEHNLKCFITEVLTFSIRFKINLRERDSTSIIRSVKRKEEIFSDDDGYSDESVTSTMLSLDNNVERISDTPSDGFLDFDHEFDELRTKLRHSLCEGCISLPKFSLLFYEKLEELLTCFQDKYQSCQWARLTVDQLSKDDLWNVYETLFEEKINWFTILTMVGFVSEMCVSALDNHKVEKALEYVTTSVTFVQLNLLSWVTDNGGWEAIVNCRSQPNDEGSHLDHVLGNMGRLAAVSAVALGSIMLCKYISNKI